MRYPSAWYQMEQTIAEHFAPLRPAQQRGLALWVYGTILGQSACQTAVMRALLAVGHWHALRQYLREWLYDGADKAAPCRSEIDVSVCFVALLRWIVSWWQGTSIALAVDATTKGQDLVALTVSVLYRGSALPVAWEILPANQKGAWMPVFLRLLRHLRPALPPGWTVLVLSDRGLWSPRLWKRIRDLGWHPLLRLQNGFLFQPVGQRRQYLRSLVPGPGHAWVGRGTAFHDCPDRRPGTLVVVWGQGYKEPSAVLTDLPPERVGLLWYGLRIWIELGFRALKGLGWHWDKTRRTDPDRVARHWLVLAVATLWVLGVGTRVEDATRASLPPERLRTPPPVPPHPPLGTPRRVVSVFALGISWFHEQLRRGGLWKRLWLLPELWPEPPPTLNALYHVAA